MEISIEGAKGVLFNIAGGADLTLSEINEASSIITQSVDPDANIIFGTTIRDDLGGAIQISVIAAGFDESRKHYGAIKRSSTFFPAQETSPKDETLPPESNSKYKVTHNEVSIEDDLDIPTFLRNKN